MDEKIEKSLLRVARFYDERKVGDVGPLGFRRSTDLTRLKGCIHTFLELGILIPGKSLFLDMGCADGRVNVLFSYLVRKSIGVELDEWTLDEYGPLMKELEAVLKRDNLPLPPDNISLFHGDSMDEGLFISIGEETGIGLKDIDLFYTYLTMQEEFADLIARRAGKGAVFMVYGLDRVMPAFKGLRLLNPDKPVEGILALYQKE